MEKKKMLYKQWWFWAIVGVIAILTIVIIYGFTAKRQESKEVNSKIENNIGKKREQSNNIKQNPYKITTDYDGVYKFVLNSDNGSGYTFTAKGAISFNNGICKAKYIVSGDTYLEHSKEYEGVCGIDKSSNSDFYFLLGENKITYQCTTMDKDMVCKLKSEFDLAGCYNKDLTLVFVDNSKELEQVLEDMLEEEKNKKEVEFKASCQTYTFEQIARNPDKMKGTKVKLTGEVIQALYGSDTIDLRVNITKTGSYSTYYTDTIYVTYSLEKGEDRILEEDIVTIYGITQGDYSYTSAIGSKVTLPLVFAEYIIIEK